MSDTTDKLIRIDITIEDEAQLDAASGVLALAAPFGWEEDSLASGEVRLTVHTEYAEWAGDFFRTLHATLPAARVERSVVPKLDWTVAWREFFTPVPCGNRFLVLAPWMLSGPEAVNPDDFPPAGRTILLIEPKTAFGTGHHPTTALCLAALSDLLDQGVLPEGGRFFDLGTGSGILSIGAAKFGLSGVAADIDPLAVDNARENAVLNQVAASIDVRPGSTQYVDETFDLIFANILAQPLKELAADILPRLKPGGALILSGLLHIQADSVEAAYTALGMPPARRTQDGEWAALIWG